jgi:hypothetical protein
MRISRTALCIQPIESYRLSVLEPAQYKSGNVVASCLPAAGLQVKQFANHCVLVLHKLFLLHFNQPV